MLNGWEIVAIFGLGVLLFGAKKLPELARGLGQGIREFKKSTREVTDDLEAAVDSDPSAAQRRLNPGPGSAVQSEASVRAAQQAPVPRPENPKL